MNSLKTRKTFFSFYSKHLPMNVFLFYDKARLALSQRYDLIIFGESDWFMTEMFFGNKFE